MNRKKKRYGLTRRKLAVIAVVLLICIAAIISARLKTDEDEVKKRRTFDDNEIHVLDTEELKHYTETIDYVGKDGRNFTVCKVIYTGEVQLGDPINIHGTKARHWGFYADPKWGMEIAINVPEPDNDNRWRIFKTFFNMTDLPKGINPGDNAVMRTTYRVIKDTPEEYQVIVNPLKPLEYSSNGIRMCSGPPNDNWTIKKDIVTTAVRTER